MYTRNIEILDSSTIASILWNPQQLEMRVNFLNGAAYIYKDIDAITFGTLCSSQSVGKYFNAIKHSLKCTKVA